MAAVEDKDLGFHKIVSNLMGFDGAEVVVGVLRDAGKASDGKTDLVNVAAYNEYGTKFIPSRPFLRIATDEQGKAWQDLAEQGIGYVIDGKMNKRHVLTIIGQRAKADVQKTLGSSKLKANAPSTVRQKGSSRPLIDEGTLRRRINYRIEE